MNFKETGCDSVEVDSSGSGQEPVVVLAEAGIQNSVFPGIDCT
jgi:hypothetical protein